MVGARRLRPRTQDVTTVGVGVVAAAVYVLHGFGGALTRDLAIYAYAGQQVADGVPPYVGIVNRAGPLAHLIPGIGAAGARLVGVEELTGMRVLFLAISVACVCMVYVVGRDLFASRRAGLAAAAAFLSFHGFIEYASDGPREKTAMVLFLLCTLHALGRQRWFVAGLWLGLGTLTWQPMLFTGLAAALVMTAVAGRRWWRELLLFAAGGLSALAACLAYFALVGAVQEFLEGFVLLNARYRGADPPIGQIGQRWGYLVNGYGISLVFIIVGFLAILVLALSALRRQRWWRDETAIPVVAAGACALAGFAWSLRDFNAWPDLFVVLPLAALGVGGAVEWLAGLAPRRWGQAVVATSVTVACVIAVQYSLSSRHHALDKQQDSVDAALRILPAGSTVMSVEAPQPLVLADLTNPTRFQTFSRGLDDYVDDTWPGGIEGFAQDVAEREPTLVAVGGGMPRWLAPTIDAEYRYVGKAPQWAWWVHQSIGRTAIADLRAALKNANAAGA